MSSSWRSCASAAAAAAAAAATQNNEAAIAAENARVEEARQAATAKINELQEQLRSCIQALDRIKMANQPKAEPAPVEEVTTTDADAVADEISKNLESIVGTTDDVAPKAEPMHPVEETTSKFANLQFGRNYDKK